MTGDTLDLAAAVDTLTALLATPCPSVVRSHRGGPSPPITMKTAVSAMSAAFGGATLADSLSVWLNALGMPTPIAEKGKSRNPC